jgi:peptide/nickel transport system substrate-binding protein
MSRIKFLSIILVLVFVMAACTPTATEAPAAEAPAEEEAEAPAEEEAEAPAEEEAETSTSGIKRGGVLRIALESDLTDLDPATSTAAVDNVIFSMVYETLVTWNRETLEPEPLLAKSWDITDDGLKYTFYLRDDVTWHNGDPFVAADVKYTVERIVNEDLASKSFLLSIDNVEVIDDHTVVFNMSEPYSPMLLNAPQVPMIQNQKFVEANDGATTRVTMGTGPFMLKEWVADEVMRLEKNPNYWREGMDGEPLPYLDGVDFIISVDETARMTDFLSGVMDMVLMVPEKDIGELMGNSSIELAGPQSVWFSSIFFNTELPPFDDKLVRQAFSWAVDRAEICEVGLFGYAAPSAGAAFPDWHWSGNGPKVYDHRDIEKAKELLAEAGYPDGEGFPEITIYAGAPYPSEVTAAEMVAAYVSELGITAKVEATEWGAFLDNIFAYSYPIYVVGWLGTGDPDDVYYNLFHSEGPFNLMKYNSPEFDDLAVQARQAADMDDRKDLYHQLEAVLLEDVPQAFLMWHDEYQGLYPYVKNFTHMPNNSKITLPEIWLDK